ncbi:MAG: tetratricopeptide repeat protein [Bacteroidia bacterium]
MIDSLTNILKTEKDDTGKVNNLNALSEKLWRIGKYDTSLVYANTSLELAKKLDFKNGIAFAYKNIGVVNYFKQNYTKALDFAKASLAAFQEIGNKDGIARCYANIGNTYDKLSNDSLSLVYAQKALTISQEIGDKQLSVIALGNIENIYFNKSDYPKAIEYSNKILTINQEIGDKNGISENFWGIGNLYSRIGNYPNALEYFYKSLKIANEAKDNPNIFNSLLSISGIYLLQKNYPKAMEYDSLAYLTNQKTGNKVRTAYVLGNMGGIYEEKGDTVKAIEYYNKALSIGEELGNKNTVAVNLTNIGTIYFMQGNYYKALEYEKNAQKMYRDEGNKVSASLSIVMTGIIYLKLKNFKQAKLCFDTSLVLSQYFRYKRVIKGAYLGLAVYDSAIGNYRSAFEDYKKYILYRDSLENDENTKKTVQVEMNYEFEQKQAAEKAEQDKKDAIAEQERNKQKVIRNSFIGGFVLMLALAFFIFRGYRQKQRANEIITKQKAEVEKQKEIVEHQKELVEQQKELVEEKNKEILDSITYAKRLQDAILPPLSLIKQFLPDSFVLYKPKDIVAGDFYWVAPLPPGGSSVNTKNPPLEGREAVLIAAADCTGHGVPGALVSVVCSNALNRTVKEFRITEPGKILDKVRELVLETFEKSESNVQDGMDISLASLTPSKGGIQIQWAGAFNTLWYIQNGEMKESPADKQPIGKTDNPKPFTTHTITLNPPSEGREAGILYLFTDGYADQFGGPKGKKFKYKQLQELLLSNASKSMEEQKIALESTLESWKDGLEQVDDILVIGIRV